MGKHTSEMKMVEIDKLIPYVNNARTHSQEQVNKLRGSLREFGFVNPVIIDSDNNVIAGHGRLMAAKEEGLTEVPCVLVDYLTEAQKKAYILADNRMAMDAGWDEELLRIEIEALQAEAFDVGLTGFDEDELADLFSDGADVEEDDFNEDEELEKEPFVEPGDVWLIGRHARFWLRRNGSCTCLPTPFTRYYPLRLIPSTVSIFTALFLTSCIPSRTGNSLML